MSKARETWIEYVKVFACILVVLGHLFQSLVSSDIIARSSLYIWFSKTIYYFHVPLFFICSGYLYQRTSRVNSFSAWGANIAKKGLALGIPYLFFSFATLLLKTVFSGSVNSQNDSVVETLFLSPASPYWYLYALFFIFLITPTFNSKKTAAVGFTIALILKFIKLYLVEPEIYVVSTVMDNEIWFIIGMAMYMLDIPAVCRSKKWLWAGLGGSILFIVASVGIICFGLAEPVIPFIMGIFGCGCTVLTVNNLLKTNLKWRLFRFLAKYTMSIFLMHTIFAAGLRAVLIKIGVTSAALHILLGLIISFIGPILAYNIMKRLKLDILLDPLKYIKLPINRRDA